MATESKNTNKSVLPSSVTQRPDGVDEASLAKQREQAAPKPTPAVAEAIKESAKAKSSKRGTVETHPLLKELGITAYWADVKTNLVVVKTFAHKTRVAELFPDSKLTEDAKHGGWTFVVNSERAQELIAAPKPKKAKAAASSAQYEMHAESCKSLTLYVATELDGTRYSYDDKANSAKIEYTGILLRASYDSATNQGSVLVKGQVLTMFSRENQMAHPELYSNGEIVVKDGKAVTKVAAERLVFYVDVPVIVEGKRTIERVETYSAINTLKAVISRMGRIAE